MFYKTAIGHANGSICGASGPAAGFFLDKTEQYGWRVYRVSHTFVVLEDCGQVMVAKKMERSPTKERTGLAARYTKFMSWTHGVLLRRLGRRRIVWLMQVGTKGHGVDYWRGNVNLVTGLKETWLRDGDRFKSLAGRGNVETGQEMVR